MTSRADGRDATSTIRSAAIKLKPLSLFLSLRFFFLPSTFHLPSQIVEYIGEFITNASYLLSLYRSREEKKKRVQHLFRFGKLNNRADSIFAREVEEGRGDRSVHSFSIFHSPTLSLSLFFSLRLSFQASL